MVFHLVLKEKEDSVEKLDEDLQAVVAAPDQNESRQLEDITISIASEELNSGSHLSWIETQKFYVWTSIV